MIFLELRLLHGGQRDRNKKWKKNEAIGNNNRRIFLLVDYIAPDITGELEKERENMLEKRRGGE